MQTIKFMNAQEIETTREYILSEIKDIYKLNNIFDMYNILFFDNFFDHSNITFKWSGRLTRAAGNIKCNHFKFKSSITLSSKLLNSAYFTISKDINGIEINNWKKAVLIVLEHELIHLYEFELYGHMSGHGYKFMNYAKNFFGHKRPTHGIMLGSQPKWNPNETKIAANTTRKEIFKLGQKVWFLHRGQKIHGAIIRRGKRVSVNTERGKWLVPYSQLIKEA